MEQRHSSVGPHTSHAVFLRRGQDSDSPIGIYDVLHRMSGGGAMKKVLSDIIRPISHRRCPLGMNDYPVVEPSAPSPRNEMLRNVASVLGCNL